MSEAISPTELALLSNLDLGDSPGHVRSGYKALLAEVDRLTTALAEARDDADFTQALANLRQLTAEREQIIGGLPYAHGQALKLRRELDIERRYSRGLRDTLRRIGALNPITHDAAMAIIRDGIPAANALALEHQRLNDATPPAAAPDRSDEEDAAYWSAAADWEQRAAEPDRSDRSAQ